MWEPLPFIAPDDQMLSVIHTLNNRANLHKNVLLSKLPPIQSQTQQRQQSPPKLQHSVVHEVVHNARTLYRTAVVAEQDKRLEKKYREARDVEANRGRAERGVPTKTEVLRTWEETGVKNKSLISKGVATVGKGYYKDFLAPHRGPPGMKGDSDDEDDSAEKTQLRNENRLKYAGAVEYVWKIPNGKTVDVYTEPNDHNARKVSTLRGPLEVLQLETFTAEDKTLWVKASIRPPSAQPHVIRKKRAAMMLHSYLFEENEKEVSELKTLWIPAIRYTNGVQAYLMNPTYKLTGAEDPHIHKYMLSNLAIVDRRVNKLLNNADRVVNYLAQSEQSLEARMLHSMRKQATLDTLAKSNAERIQELFVGKTKKTM
eukprot:PhF_6_TR19059/c0_g1_i2/m.28013